MSEHANHTSVPSRIPAGGWEADDRRREMERDTARAQASKRRWTVIGSLLMICILMWFFRWSVTPIPGSNDRAGYAYALDRLTGVVFLFAGGAKMELILEKP